MSLTGKSPSETYKDITYVDNDNNGVTTSLKQVKTGNGSNTALQVSDRSLQVKSATNNVDAFAVRNSSNRDQFLVDTTNSAVYAVGHHVNTMYKEFGVFDFAPTQNVYYPLPCNATFSNNDAFEKIDTIMGTGPATSLDISSITNNGAENLVASMWYLPDNITINAGKVFATASGHDLGCKIFSYDIVSSSGATGGDLSNGTELCTGNVPSSNNAVSIAGLTISSANVTAGKVILAMLRNETGTNRFTAKIQIKRKNSNRKKSLLEEFGSAKAVGTASISDLLKVEGINKSTAQKIFNFFN